MTRPEQKEEAIKRMKLLNMHETPIREFEEKGLLNQSEHGGMLYWLNEDQIKRVKDFEEKYNAVVYHIIHSYIDIGEMLSLLYVSEDKKEWEYDRDDLQYGYAVAYVINLDDEWCSEFGSIGIEPRFGGLIRTA